MKKLLGSLALLTFLCIYAIIVVALATSDRFAGSALVQLLFYAAAGLLWVPPAAWLIWWMER